MPNGTAAFHIAGGVFNLAQKWMLALNLSRIQNTAWQHSAQTEASELQLLKDRKK